MDRKIQGLIQLFTFQARFYVEAKLNLNLRSELTKIFDKVVLQPVIDRLFSKSNKFFNFLYKKFLFAILAQLRVAQNSAFAVQPATMESVVRALYKLRPSK